MASTSKLQTYYVLLVNRQHPKAKPNWEVEFGSYDRADVTGERESLIGSYDSTADRFLRKKDFYILKVTSANSDLIATDVARLNHHMQVR